MLNAESLSQTQSYKHLVHDTKQTKVNLKIQAAKPKMAKPVPKLPLLLSQQQGVSKKRAEKAAKMDKKAASKAADDGMKIVVMG